MITSRLLNDIGLSHLSKAYSTRPKTSTNNISVTLKGYKSTFISDKTLFFVFLKKNTMTTKLLTLGFLCITLMLSAQVGIGTVSPTAALDIESATEGVLIPRVVLTATNVATIATPTISELVYNTTDSAPGPNQVVHV
jgi:hypothetical protein